MARWRRVLRGTVVMMAMTAGAGAAMGAETAFQGALMPLPARLTAESGELSLAAPWRVTQSLQSARLDRAVSRALGQLSQRTGVRFDGKTGVTASSPHLELVVKGEGEAVQGLDEDESYQMQVTSGGVRISANTVAGAMHGLETMLQLVGVGGGGGGYQMPLVTVEDAPRFRWRGLMIDCSRHFEPMPVLKRMLDGMAAVKMNVFHWHLTDDQGFRIESKRFPKLTEVGSDGLFYTQEDARELVRYARDRGIRVVPEFEMPGHSTAWLVAYPELSSGAAPAGIRREFGISDVAIDPTREETYTFLKGFLTEMAGIFPDAYVHIGGDETPAPDWKTSPRIQAFMKAHGLKDSDALQAYLNQRVLAILTGLGKKMIGWDEILNPALPKDVVVQSWRGEASLIKGAKQGYQGVLSAPYYLDAMKSAGQHYLADPLPSTADLTAEQRRLILGGEVCMWAEQLNEWTIDSRVWPRTAAIAERFWSPEGVRDVGDMYRRLEPVSLELEAVGLQHLSEEGVGLRQLAGSEQIDALRVFASVFEPVSFSERYQQQKTSQLTVLDRFVDALRPDANSRREFAALTTAFLANPRGDTADRDRLLELLDRLGSSVPVVKAQMVTAPRLRDVDTRADELVELTAAGMEAVRLLAAGTSAPKGWHDQRQALVKRAGEPSAIVRFTMLDSLQALFAAVPEGQ